MNNKKPHPLLRQITFDLKHGIGMTKKNFLVPFFLSFINCLGYYNLIQQKNEHLDVYLSPTLFDYIFHFFEGMPIFRSELKLMFFIPASWVLFYFWLVYINGKYPKTYLHGLGIQVLIRSNKIEYWWISKCVFIIAHTLVYYLVTYGIIGISTLTTGPPYLLQLTARYQMKNFQSEWEVISAGEFFMISVVLPIVVTISLCLLQTVISLLTNTVFGILCSIMLLIASAYVCKWYWIGNYLMILRNNRFDENGVSCYTGIAIAACLSTACAIIGNAVLKKKDFIAKKGEI